MPQKTSRLLTGAGALLAYSRTTDFSRFIVTPKVYSATKCLNSPSTTGNVPLGAVMSYENNTPFSVYIRMKQASPPSGLYGSFFVYKRYQPTGKGWCLQTDPTTGYTSAWFMDGTGKYLGVRNTAASVCNNAWHSLVLTYSGSGAGTGLYLYVDGSAATQAQYDNGPLGSIVVTDSAYFFDWQSATGCVGRISDAAAWNRVLTSTEVLAVYNGGVPADMRALPSAPALTNLWWCGDDNDSASIVYDRIGTGHGTLAGGVTVVTDS